MPFARPPRPQAPDCPDRRRQRTVVAALAAIGVAAAAAVVAVVSLPVQGDDAEPPRTTPDVAALAGPLAEQELTWEDCEFDAGLAAPAPGADLSNVECATIEVPRDWTDPDPDATWQVRISQARNVEPTAAEYHTTVIAHPGGPYTSGLSFASTVQMQTPELRPTTNYVSFDQRGLGQSSRAECAYEYDPADGDLAQVRAIGEACAADPQVATMTTEQTAYDMDFIRHLLDLETVTYMGYSYGTWLGTWYGSLFADRIERMVFDSAVDVTASSIQTLYDAAHEARDRQFRLHLVNWLARNDATYGLGTDPEAIWQRYFDATSSPAMTETARYAWNSSGAILGFSTGLAYPLTGSLVAGLIAEGETGGAADPVHAAHRVIERLGLPDAQLETARATLAALSAPAPGTPGETTQATYGEVIDFTKCTDGEWQQGAEHWERFAARTARVAPLSAQLGLLDVPQACAFWPTDQVKPVVPDDFPSTLVLQSELDSMTPFEQGRSAGTGLPNTSLITVDNEHAHGVFPYGTDEVDRPVVDFLLGGDRPARTIVAAAKPLPLEQSTFESWSRLGDDVAHGAAEPRFTDPTVPARTAELAEGAEAAAG